jgi:nucleoside phosphorylase
MKITCISALKMEAAWLLSRLTDARVFKIDRIRTWTGRLGEHEVSFLICGVGPEKARQSLEGCGMLQEAEHIFHLGVCGALDPGLSRYKVLIAETVAATYEPENVPIRLKDLDEKLLAGLQPGQVPVKGKILTHPRPVFSSRLRDMLHSRFSADGVEMEAWEVASFCRRNDIPLTVVKAVSDFADSKSTVSFPFHARKAAQAAARVVLAMLRAL